MKVLLVSTFYRYGGAAIAAKRVAESLKKQSIDTELIYLMDKKWEFEGSLLSGFYWKLKFYVLFFFERFLLRIFLSKKIHLFKFSLARIGSNFTKHPAIQKADIINFHWVHFSFFSMPAISELAQSKSVFWTMQDMWIFTGGCHYSFDCLGYQSDCAGCFYMKKNFESIPRNILASKSKLFKDGGLNLIATSTWMKSQALQSAIFRDADIPVIPNAIDLDIFKPLEKNGRINTDDRNFKILIGAVDTRDPRKGFQYLDELIMLLHTKIRSIELMVFGETNPTTSSLPCKTTLLGTISGDREMVKVYCNADVYLHLAVQDNAPLVVSEALACGLPVVSFDSGGVGDIVISDETGYLVEVGDVKGMAENLVLLGDKKVRKSISLKAREKAVEMCDSVSVAKSYEHVFRNFYEPMPVEKP